MPDNNGNLVPGIIRPIIICILTMLLGVILGISGYWASYVTEGAQRSAINETKLSGIVKEIDTMKVDIRADLRDIKAKLDKLNDVLIKGNKNP